MTVSATLNFVWVPVRIVDGLKRPTKAYRGYGGIKEDAIASAEREWSLYPKDGPYGVSEWDNTEPKSLSEVWQDEAWLSDGKYELVHPASDLGRFPSWVEYANEPTLDGNDLLVLAQSVHTNAQNELNFLWRCLVPTLHKAAAEGKMSLPFASMIYGTGGLRRWYVSRDVRPHLNDDDKLIEMARSVFAGAKMPSGVRLTDNPSGLSWAKLS